MYGIMKRGLETRARDGNPIRAGFVGAGRMGTGAICQIGQMRGMRVAAIADLAADRAIRAFELCGFQRGDVVLSNRAAEANDAIRAGRPVVTESAELLPELELEAVVDATGVPDVGARIAMQTIMAGKHAILLNVETDVAIGPILAAMAERAGVVYTVASGDEPGLIAEFYDRYSLLGFEVVAVGKAASSLAYFDPYATPESLAEEARRLGINPHFLVTFRDGTKTMIEMAAVSNYTGLVPDVPGMHGPIAGVEEIVRLFRPKSEGGILNRRGVVDFARPLMTPAGKIDFHRNVTPGVFLVLYTGHRQLRDDLDYLDVT
ncbi:MAG: homoserine dehydrogenase, partial [Acetobacteraceae bacterium]